MPFVVSDGTVRGLHSAAPRRPLGLTDYNGLSYSYATIWRTQPAVRTVIGWLARNVAPLRFNLYRRLSSTERETMRDHPLAALLRAPAPHVSRHKFLAALVNDLGIFDTAVLVKLRAGDRLALVRIPPRMAEPIGGTFLGPDGFRITGNGTTTDLPAEQVVYLTGYSPDGDGWGTSPIETLRLRLLEELAASQYRADYWRNGARVSGVITRPPANAAKGVPEWSPEARERFERSWHAQWSGRSDDAGGTPVLEEGMDYKPVTLSAQESEFLDARKLTRQEVAAAYHVNAQLVGAADQASGEELREARKTAMTDSLSPVVDFIAGELYRQLAPDFGLPYDPRDHYIEANLEERLRGDFLDQAEVISRSVGGPWLTRAEARALANRPFLDGQDTERLIVPLNVILGGRQSPADTAPGTPGAGQVGTAARKAIAAGGAKAAEDLPGELAPWAEQAATVVGDFLDRQRASVLSRIGAGQTVAEALEVDAVTGRSSRWDDELRDDLFGLALSMAEDITAAEADRWGIDYDVATAEAWLYTNARIEAEQWNARTLDALSSTGLNARAGGAKLDEVEATATELAAQAFESRAASIGTFAVGRVTTPAAFLASDVAEQGGATTKTWRTNSTNPRSSHAALNGVTIPIGSTFANGGLWPGDPQLPVDEVADCTCTIEFGN